MIRKSPAKHGTKPDTDPGRAGVEQYLDDLAHPLKPEVEALRRIILKSDPRITEGIKWNAPSFCSNDWFATFDLRSKEWVQIVFYRGAKVKAPRNSRYVNDASNILKWITNDRCTARFVSEKDVKSKAAALAKVVAEWVENLSRETS